MAEINPEVMQMVEEELTKSPKINTRELKEKAEKIDKGIAKLSIRQFHATYPLQVMRKRAPANPRRGPSARRRRRGRGEMAIDRDAIRAILLDFGRAVAAAEEKADVVAVIGTVDNYVNQIARIAGAA